jgi:hypothetical protein
MKLNGTYQLLAYVDDVNLLGDNTGTIKKNKETIIDAVKKAGLKINIEKTIRCCFITRMKVKIITQTQQTHRLKMYYS